MSTNGVIVDSNPRFVEKNFTGPELKAILDECNSILDACKNDPLENAKKFQSFGSKLKSYLEQLGIIKAVKLGKYGSFMAFIVVDLLNAALDTNQEAVDGLINNLKDITINLYRTKDMMATDVNAYVQMKIAFTDFKIGDRIYDCPLGYIQKALYRNGQLYTGIF